MDYLRDPAAIYEKSFATIRGEADLSTIPDNAKDIAVRIIHACGMIDIVNDICISPDFFDAAASAIKGKAEILTDAEMVRHGIISKSLTVTCTLNDPRARDIGIAEKITRSAAAVELWRDRLKGSVVVIGNAPTALYRLLEMVDDGADRPAALVAMPVGFVGAAESKQELIGNPRGIPFITVKGRRGGSAMAAAVINALTQAP
jgi:precorrin-8X/cobalt-precorrin-8 methylmutase